MPEFRTASGLVDCTPYVRTASGMVATTAVFHGQSGSVISGGGATLTAAANPADVYGAATSPRHVTTGSTTILITGGVAPFTFAWTGFTGFTIGSPAAATTNFTTTTNVANGTSVNGSGTCVVTDSAGAHVSVAVTATAENFGGSFA